MDDEASALVCIRNYLRSSGCPEAEVERRIEELLVRVSEIRLRGIDSARDKCQQLVSTEEFRARQTNLHLLRRKS